MAQAHPRIPDPDRIRVASTSLDDVEAAVRDLFRGFDLPELAGIMLFCSSRYDLDQLAAALDRRAEGLVIVGCTSSGELTPDGLAEGTITAIGFPASTFRMAALCVDQLDQFDAGQAQRDIRLLAASARAASAELGETAHSAAIFLVDGLSHREEMLTLTIQDALGEVPLLGGSSGDGLAFRETFVYFEGRFRRDAAIVALLTSTRPIKVFSIQHYDPGATRMVITRANPVARIVHEINAEPAAAEYARLTGTSEAELEPGHFAAHPPMVRAGGQYYVRSIQSAHADGSLTFYCAIDEGLVLTLGEPGDVCANLAALFRELDEAVGGTDQILAFDCVLNMVEIERRQMRDEVSRLYRAAGVVGFNTYGEQFHALHVNQTFTGIAFGR
jgi:hypothetical protein